MELCQDPFCEWNFHWLPNFPKRHISVHSISHIPHHHVAVEFVALKVPNSSNFASPWSLSKTQFLRHRSHAYLQAVFIIATVAIATIRLRIHLEIGVRLFATARRRHCHGWGDPLKLWNVEWGIPTLKCLVKMSLPWPSNSSEELFSWKQGFFSKV